METLQAAVMLQGKNTVWTKMDIVQVLHTLAPQHAHTIQIVTTLAANQDIANILRIAQVVFQTQDYQLL